MMVTVPTLVEVWVQAPGVSLSKLVLGTQAALLLTGVTIQLIRMEERLTFFPPIFFIMGLSFLVVGRQAGMIGFFAIWAINIVLPNAAAFLATYAAGIVILAIFLGSGVRGALLMAALAGFPPIVAVLFRRRLA
ncbi:MAG: hypothetical protein J6386_21345 [Candidatus Synoicihabitans palmerolidicus]|nr:hypothetical protein [Candidatus Synoicihabitans palmerolidicus]